MIEISIGGKSYTVPTLWEEITLQKAWEVEQIVRKESEERVESLLDPTNESMAVGVELFRELFVLLTGVPKEAIERVADEEVVEAGRLCFVEYIAFAVGRTSYTPSGMSSFRLDESRYHLPECGMDVVGEPMPFHQVTAREFCQATDLVAIDNLQLAPLVVAVLCRPKREKYSSERVKKRAESFGELPANIYMELRSMLSQTHSYMREEYPECYAKGGSKKGKTEPSTWNDRLLYVADDKPSELPYVEEANAYEFMRLLNGKIKREREKWEMMTPLRLW